MSLLLAYYGDDFTGSTDALEFLSRAGARAVLFMEMPSVMQLERFGDLDAFGVAGMTRAMGVGEMESALRPAFEALAGLGAQVGQERFRVPHVHYKVCSTFDSSPMVGSIGRAIDIGASVFGGPVPVLGGAPALGRYYVFGNLFARMGIGSGGSIYRLDRHPSMSRHPVTPADEGDLRLHLGRQTARKIGLLDILGLGLPLEEQLAILNGSEVVLIDVLEDGQLEGIGRLLEGVRMVRGNGGEGGMVFSVGSSAVEMALGMYWQKMGRLVSRVEWPEAGKVEQLLVASGSCSPVTAGQIAWAKGNGFAEMALDVGDIEGWGKCVEQAVEFLDAGRSLILHTGDTAAVTSVPAALLGMGLGRLVKEVVDVSRGVGRGGGNEAAGGLRRLVIAGGDTSSYAARALGIEAVEMICPLSPGAPLCRVHAPGSPVDGMEIVLKGGQVGGEDYFGRVLTGIK